MRIEFCESFNLPVQEVYEFLRSPADWPRLYGSYGDVIDYGNGWLGVPIKNFPFPLVARTTGDVPSQRVRWDLGGFWRGDGEVNFEVEDGVTRVTGYETVRVPYLLFLAPLAERLLLEKRFQGIWRKGWRRLHAMEPSSDAS